MRAKSLLLSVATICVTPVLASAQETICDPENPACVEVEEEPSAGDVEVIADPDNPATATELIEDPENVAFVAEQPDTADSFTSARFLGAWGTRLDVDSSFDGQREDIVELSSDFDLGLEWDASERLRVVVQGNFRHWIGAKENPDEVDLLLNATDARAAYDARVGESYVMWKHDFWSIALGNLITRWGSTDLVRPGDVLNPVDQTSFSALAAPPRLPQLTADLTVSGDWWNVQALVVPFFVPDRTWAFGRDSSLLTSRNPVIADQFPIDSLLDELIDRSIQDDVQPLVSATRAPDEVPRNVSLGLRGTVTVANTDLGAGWWRGWDRTPFIFADDDFRALLTTILADGQVLEDFDFLAFFLRNPELVQVTDRISERVAAGEELFYSEHRRMQMFLLDGARYVGPIGVRADIAFFPQKTYLTEAFDAVRRPTLAPALGLSWERFESEDDALTVTLEGFWNRPFDADDGITEALVPEELRGSPDDPLLVVGDGLYGVSGAVLWAIPWIESQLQVGGVYNVSHGDFIASAAFSRELFGSVTGSVAYTLFAGPDPEDDLTLGGIYDTNDHFSFAVSGVF